MSNSIIEEFISYLSDLRIALVKVILETIEFKPFFYHRLCMSVPPIISSAIEEYRALSLSFIGNSSKNNKEISNRAPVIR